MTFRKPHIPALSNSTTSNTPAFSASTCRQRAKTRKGWTESIRISETTICMSPDQAVGEVSRSSSVWQQVSKRSIERNIAQMGSLRKMRSEQFKPDFCF
jgi:hypothetical protein